VPFCLAIIQWALIWTSGWGLWGWALIQAWAIGGGFVLLPIFFKKLIGLLILTVHHKRNGVPPPSPRSARRGWTFRRLTLLCGSTPPTPPLKGDREFNISPNRIPTFFGEDRVT